MADSDPGDESRPRRVDKLAPELYADLKDRAQAYLRREAPGHTLQPTALVHEAYLRMQARPDFSYSGRTHFMATAADVMRHVLVDHARARLADKRGGGAQHITLDEESALTDDRLVDILEIDRAIEKLAGVDEPSARVTVLRFFGGLTEAEIAEAMGKSVRWVRDQWVFARTWLRRELDPGRGNSA